MFLSVSFLFFVILFEKPTVSRMKLLHRVKKNSFFKMQSLGEACVGQSIDVCSSCGFCHVCMPVHAIGPAIMAYTGVAVADEKIGSVVDVYNRGSVEGSEAIRYEAISGFLLLSLPPGSEALFCAKNLGCGVMMARLYIEVGTMHVQRLSVRQWKACRGINTLLEQDDSTNDASMVFIGKDKKVVVLPMDDTKFCPKYGDSALMEWGCLPALGDMKEVCKDIYPAYLVGVSPTLATDINDEDKQMLLVSGYRTDMCQEEWSVYWNRVRQVLFPGICAIDERNTMVGVFPLWLLSIDVPHLDLVCHSIGMSVAMGDRLGHTMYNMGAPLVKKRKIAASDADNDSVTEIVSS